MPTISTPSDNSYLGPIGTLTNPTDSAVGYQATSSSNGTHSYLLSIDNQANSDGRYNWEIWQVGSAGAISDSSPSYSGHHFSYFYDVLRAMQITTKASSSDSQATTQTLLFGHSTDYDEQNDGYYTFTYWINSDGSLGDGEYGTYWKDPCPNVATFEIDGTTYLWAQTDKANSQNYYDWNVYEVSSSGELKSVSSGSWIYCYDTISFFTTYTKEANGDDTPSIYFYASSSNVNVENSSYYWCVTPVTYSSKNKEFFADDAVYHGFTKTLYQPGVLVQNPFTGNRFMFMASSSEDKGLYPWQMLQLTEGSNVGESAKTGATTLIKPVLTPYNGGTFMNYATFTAIPTTGLTYLFASTDIANSSGEYFYTIQTVMQGGELFPSSITSEYLHEMILHTTKANANSNAANAMGDVKLITKDIEKYQNTVKSDQKNLQTYASEWIEERNSDIYNILSIYQDSKTDLATYLKNANTANSKIATFNAKESTKINVSYKNSKGTVLTAEEWVDECVTQANTLIGSFNEINIGNSETLVGLIEDMQPLLSKFQDSKKPLTNNLSKYIRELTSVESSLTNTFNDIKTIELGGSGVNEGHLEKLIDLLDGHKADLKVVNQELHKTLITIIVALGADVVIMGLFTLMVVEGELALLTGLVIGLVLLLITAVGLYFMIKYMKSLESKQEKLIKEIANEKEAIAEISVEIPAMHILASVAQDLSGNIEEIVTTATNTSSNLTDIQDQLNNAAQEVEYIKNIDSQQVIKWLNSHSKTFPKITYNASTPMTVEDSIIWSEKIGAQIKAYFIQTPAHISGITSSLHNACQQAENLAATSQLNYSTMSLSDFEAKSNG